MNFKHGFNSNNPNLNPDNRLLGADSLTQDDLILAERFLHGESCGDQQVRAHMAAKAIAHGSRFRYPSLFERAIEYVQSDEFHTFERLLAN